MDLNFVEVLIGILVSYLFYRLSISDPHHWRTFPRFAGDAPNKMTALVVSILVGIGIVLLEGMV